MTKPSVMIKVKNLFRPSAIIALLAAGLLTMEACNTTKKTAVTEPVKPVAEGKKPEEYLAQKIDYTSFNSKASIHFENKDQNQDFTSNIRMNKGKDIWSSIIALGITEVARAYITPDSLKAMVRIGKKAYVLSYKEGLELIQAQVEFPVLQNLFIGNPLIGDVPVKSSSEKDSLIMITQEKDDFTQVLTFNKQSGVLHELTLSSTQRNFKCEIKYNKYGAITGKQPFAFDRAIVITNKGETVKLDMEFSKAELDVPVDVTFAIPSSYERVQIKKK